MTGLPGTDGITASTPQCGQSAVWPTPWSSVSTHSKMSAGTNVTRRYRDVRSRAAAAGDALTDVALARELGCRNATISGWKRDAGFREWFDAEARAAVEHLWRPILLRAAQLALQGSVEHMKFLAPFMASDIESTGSPRATQVQVIIGVPRPALD